MAGAGAPKGVAADGAWLRRLRTGAGLTQAQLASQASVGIRTVRELERGTARPRASSLHRLASALGVDPEQLDRLAHGDVAPAASRSAAGPAAPDAAESLAGQGDPGSADLRVDVLGRLAVHRGSREIAVPSALQRTLLGLLAVQPDRTAGIEEIIDTLWDDAPPRTCRELVHSYISNLRRLLASPDGSSEGEPPLRREQGGYRLRLGPTGSDVARFTDLAARARRAAQAGAAQSAWQLHGEALSCWRGRLFAAEGTWWRRHPAAIALAAEQVAVAVEWADIGLGLGAYARTALVLQALCAQEPLHEGLAARLMVALTGDGRQSAALALFDELRTRLDTELGVRPGPELREAHLRVLRGRLPLATQPVGLGRDAGDGSTAADDDGHNDKDDASAKPAANNRDTTSAKPETPDAPAHPPRVPAQLPADCVGFAGRAAELRRLDSALIRADQGGAPAVVLSGMAGVGKTALVIRWARAVSARFPDGRLYADLRGHSPHESAQPLDVLAAFLGAFGVSPGGIPADVDQASALLRSLLDGRRVLIVLDNAADAEQVRPLLPASPGCVALVTSRKRLGGLIAHDGAELIAVQPLTASESVQVLMRSVGETRARAEGAAVAEIAELCAHLPLALRITAANLATRPTHRIAEHVERLSAAGERLDALTVQGDPRAAVRGAFRLSCDTLDPDALRVFRLLGLVPGPDVTAEQCGALANLSTAEARANLDQLADRNLLTEYRSGRYRLHDLVRLYAAELAQQQENEHTRAQAMRRLTDYCLSGVALAAELLYPHLLSVPDEPSQPAVTETGPVFRDSRAALAWLDEERPGLVALMVHLADAGATNSALVLAHHLNGYCLVRADRAHWPTIARTALQAAVMSGDGAQLAMAWLQCGMATRAVADYEAAIGHLTRSARAARHAGWSAGEAVAVNNLATVFWARGRGEDTIRLLGEALELHRRAGRKAGEAVTLANLGAAHIESAHEHAADPEARQAHLRDAMRLLDQAWQVHREIGDTRNEGDTMRLLAVVHRELGDDSRALELARDALHRANASGDVFYQAYAHSTLATMLARTGEPVLAIKEHEFALRLARAAHAARETAEALIDLAETQLRLGRVDDAVLTAADAQGVAAGADSVPLSRAVRRVRARVAAAGKAGAAAQAADPIGRMLPLPAASPR